MNLSIETSSFCNFSCKFCPQSKCGLKNRIMPMVLFKAIVDSICELKIPVEWFCFDGIGEPLTDNSLFEKAKYALKFCKKQLLFTNGSLFTKEKIESANELMSLVYFSIHGNTPSEYEALTGGNFEEIKKTSGLAHKILGKKLAILNYPGRKLGKYLGLPLAPVAHPFHNWGDEEIAKRMNTKIVNPCRCPLLIKPSIRVDGSFSTCGIDWNQENNFLLKRFPKCERCSNADYFKSIEHGKELNDHIEVLRKLDSLIKQRVEK